MSVATNISRRAVRIASSVVNIIILTAIVLLLAFSGYALWDSKQVYALADAQQYEKFKPTDSDGGLSFQELQKINPDVFAWLDVYGTHIDYPVVQGPDNQKYIDTNAEGHYSLTGALFLDYRNKKDFSDFASIIYGHHMEKKTMFGEIGLFANTNYFNVRRYGTLYYDGKEHGLEFFAFIRADAYDERVYQTKFDGASGRQAYLDLLLDHALHVRSEVPVTTDDRIVLLSTCSASGTNARDILIGRLTDTVNPDPFVKKSHTVRNPIIDHLTGLWAKIPLPAKYALATLPLWLIILALILAHRKKVRARQISDATTIEETL